jgi:hypothetical protein
MPEETPRRELVVFTDPTAQTRIDPSRARSLNGRRLGHLATVARDSAVEFSPMFGHEDRWHHDCERRGGLAKVRGRRLARMGSCYTVAADDDRLDDLAAELLEQDVVDGAYVQTTAPELQALIGADVRALQGHMTPAPVGVDAPYGWSIPGGRGSGVTVICYEYGYIENHEDQQQNFLGTVAGTNNTYYGQHGSAMLGIIGADDNEGGANGIAPDAQLGFAGYGGAARIIELADYLSPGDVIVMAMGDYVTGWPKSVPMDYFPDRYLAIRYATDNGIVFVHSAGNGQSDLDDAFFDIPKSGYPAWWSNPFRRTDLDSGAILVGGGMPETVGYPWHSASRDYGPPRARWANTNPVSGGLAGGSAYGACVDAQAWGVRIATHVGGIAYYPAPDTYKYTNSFGGTSGASAIVAGVCASIQGAMKAAGKSPLTSLQMRSVLRSTGSPQVARAGYSHLIDAPLTQRVGNQPDLAEAIPAAMALEEIDGTAGAILAEVPVPVAAFTGTVEEPEPDPTPPPVVTGDHARPMRAGRLFTMT